jgi:hypothetical protein
VVNRQSTRADSAIFNELKEDKDEELPSKEVIRQRLNQLGYSLKTDC